ncbi:MAG: PDZ domain-containing protein [Armatimonadetes bacterium]|nr:PDZ domain-containing protein [Armatimonadota bacterium]
MKNYSDRSYVRALLVCGAALSAYAGSVVRDRLGNPQTALISNSDRLLASRSKGAMDLNETEYFHELADLLKDHYVDPVNDETKLANGAVRGMVGSLGDVNSVYMDQNQFQTYQNQLKGEFAGIGVETYYEPDKGELTPDEKLNENVYGFRYPKVVIGAVLEGSAAQRAGLLAGDHVVSIDGHWIIDTAEIRAYQRLARKNPTDKASLDELTRLRKRLRLESDDGITPGRAVDRLTSGTTGAIQLVVNRNGETKSFTVNKADLQTPVVDASNGLVKHIVFGPTTVQLLRKAIEGKPQVTIDLRNNVVGDYVEMKNCLAVLAPSGVYGSLVGRGGGTSVFDIKSPDAHHPTVKVIVDSTTKGPAEIFAKALAQCPGNSIAGSMPKEDVPVVKSFNLPQGAGYTLATALYREGR